MWWYGAGAGVPPVEPPYGPDAVEDAPPNPAFVMPAPTVPPAIPIPAPPPAGMPGELPHWLQRALNGAAQGPAETLEAFVDPATVTTAAAVVTIGMAAWEVGKRLFSGPPDGNFVNSSDVVTYSHPNTPVTQPKKACKVTFSLRARAGLSLGVDIDLDALDKKGIKGDTKDFWYVLNFEYNGNDVFNASIGAVDQSKRASGGTIITQWQAMRISKEGDPVAKLHFELRDSRADFKGQSILRGGIDVSATGEVKFNIWSTDRFGTRNDWVVAMPVPPLPPIAGNLYGYCPLIKPYIPVGPIAIPIQTFVFFRPGKAQLEPASEDRFAKMLANWSTTNQRLVESLRNGETPIYITAYASQTGSGRLNRELTKARAASVEGLMRQMLGLGAQAKVVVSALGKDAPTGGTRGESDWERRVDIQIPYRVG
jgi:outer membrane protein OmpA-like peptidoglycan-associated protein